MTLSKAVYNERRVWLRYQATDKRVTERYVDPYGLVYTIGYWYLVGYCHLRQDLRTFRIDRILTVELQSDSFARPVGFDVLAYAEESIARKPWIWSTKVILQTTLEEAKRLLPAATMLEPTTQGVAMTTYVEDLGEFAHFLLRLECPLQLCSPPELQDEFRKLAAKATKFTALDVCEFHIGTAIAGE